MSTQTETHIEDMPSVDNVVVCLSRHVCDKRAQVVRTRTCCDESTSRYKLFLCLEHYMRWVTEVPPADTNWICRDCGLVSNRSADFATYREL